MQQLNQRSESSITFDVSDVVIAAESLEEQNARLATERIVDTPIESCSDYAGTFVKTEPIHPLFAAAGHAFMEHRPLVLSPDIIWLTIVQGLAKHINLDPEKHRHDFVVHHGTKSISVRRDDLVPGSLENQWNEVFTDFALHVRENLNDGVYRLILANFSTTGPVERAASELALMSTVKAFFRFELHTLCGIPRVTLEGTPTDWAVLEEKINAMERFAGLEFWLPSLKAIGKQLVAASSGNIDRDYWQNMYKVNSFSGGPYINGWLTHLVPYTECGDKITANPCLNGGSITDPQLPTAISVVPFIWDFLGTQLEYEFLTGLVGVQQERKTLGLRPKVGWAVRTKEQSMSSFSGHRRKEALKRREESRKNAPVQRADMITFPMYGETLLANKVYDKAIAVFTKLMEDEPKHFLYRLKRGRAYLGNSQFELALNDFNEVIRINPELAVTYAERAKANEALGRFEEAQQDAAKASHLGYTDNGNI